MKVCLRFLLYFLYRIQFGLVGYEADSTDFFSNGLLHLYEINFFFFSSLSFVIRERSMWHAIRYFAHWLNVEFYFSILKKIIFWCVCSPMLWRMEEIENWQLYSYGLIGSIDSTDSYWIRLCANISVSLHRTSCKRK